MNYNTLKQILKKEREHKRLTILPENFYRDCASYFKSGETSIRVDDTLSVREYRNAYNSYTEIVERRINKITEKAYFQTLNNNKLNTEPPSKDEEEVPTNILQTEKELYRELLRVYDEFYVRRFLDYKNASVEGELI